MIEMTREEAIKELNTFKISAKSELGENALVMAIQSLSADYKAQYEDYLKKSGIVISQLRADRDRLLEALNKVNKAKTEIEDEGAFEQETKGKTEYLRGIDYCLEVLNEHLGE